MVLNAKKTKTMLFNRGRNCDFEPIIKTPEGSTIEYTRETKLLGVIINDNLNTWDNTKHIENKCYKRIWMLRRLANLGCGKDDLVMTYVRQIRSICEFAVPYWGSMLTKEESRRIERVQRTALHVIMGESFIDYKNALLACGLERLDERRMKLIISFAKRLQKTLNLHTGFCRIKKVIENTGYHRLSTRLFIQELKDLRGLQFHS